MSFALWMPTIWMLLIASKPLGVWFGTGGVDMESGNPLDRAFLSGIFCLCLLILAIRQFDWSNIIKKNVWLLLLLGYMLISISWSDMPYISFKRYIRQVIAVVMSLMIASEPEPLEALKCLLRRTIYILIPFSYILIHYFPKYGREYARWSGKEMWIGVTSQKNGLAALCLISAIFLIWSFIRRRQGRDIPVVRYQTFLEAFLLILALWLMGGPQHNFSYSVTTNVSFIIGLLALIGLFLMMKKYTASGLKAFIAITAFIIIYGSITPFIGKLIIVDVSSTFGRDETLTGRSDIWANLIPYALKRPVLGYGIGGFWTDAIRQQTSSHAHNGYLDIILNIGFVGHMLFSMFLLSCCQKAQKMLTYNFDWGALWICYLLIAVVHNIAESSTIGFTSLISATLLFLMITSSTATSYA
jgi:exopolysaccharide production protein ExoQ